MEVGSFPLNFDDYYPTYKVTTEPSIRMHYAYFFMSFGDGEMASYGKDYTEEKRRNQMIEKIKRK